MTMFKKIIPLVFMVAFAFSFSWGTLMGKAVAAEAPISQDIYSKWHSPHHTADERADWTISLSELLRVVQLYQLGSYFCDPMGEDGFRPGEGDQTCLPHNSDYNAQDWIISFDELLRITQLFNAFQYYSCPGVGEDGFCPVGPTDVVLPSGALLEMVNIPAGSFNMGSDTDSSEQLIHTVNIDYTFQLGKFEVTQEQWEAVMHTLPGSQSRNPSLPVVLLSWDEIQLFLTKLNRMRLGTFRLPSEAEWEYACRAGTTTLWSHGDDEAELENYAWYNNAVSTAQVVGQKLPNSLGLHDMHGNVGEWVQDEYHANYTGAPTDGSAWESLSGSWASRVIRGGSWRNRATYVRSTYRGRYIPPAPRSTSVGFRLLRQTK